MAEHENAHRHASGRRVREGFDWGLSDCRVLITGASSGLGWHFAKFFAEAGASVALAARRIDRLEALASEIEDQGGSAIAVEMDVCDVGSMTDAVEQVETGVGPIDVLVNNAGAARFENGLEQDVDGWDVVQATNLRGPWYLSGEVARRMRDNGREGTIVNIASIAGLRQSPFMAGYCTSKAALIQLTACLALEFAPFGIRVNAIAPGVVKSDMSAGFIDSPAGTAMLKRLPLGRFGTVEDLKCALLWLSSRHSSFVTGSCVVIDGGLMVGSL